MTDDYRVLGVDPGSSITGWGLVRRCRGKLSLEESGLIRTSRSSSFAERLATLHRELEAILGRTKPDAFAIESVFHARHARAALQLGHARGVLVLAAAQRGLEVFEYPPATVKKAVTGNGRADKVQVRKMVELLLEAEIEGALDRSDALAVAICHAHAGGFTSRLVEAKRGTVTSGRRPGGMRRVKG